MKIVSEPMKLIEEERENYRKPKMKKHGMLFVMKLRTAEMDNILPIYLEKFWECTKKNSLLKFLNFP